ncbi:hypothetical protein [Corynebacterium halotolerans]|nr:hypothetical protein [Corynebacterium halotolerans]
MLGRLTFYPTMLICDRLIGTAHVRTEEEEWPPAEEPSPFPATEEEIY